MEGFFRKLIEKRKIVYVATIIICIVSIILKAQVEINYDMKSFLPKDSVSRVGDEFLIEHYDKSSTALLMIEDYNIETVKNTVEKIRDIENVKKVKWMGDVVDTSIPIEFINQNAKEQFIKENNMIVVIEFDKKTGDPLLDEAVINIKSILPEKVYFGGEPIVGEYIKSKNQESQSKTLVIALTAMAVILTLATSSYIEPFLFLLTIGISIIINQGSNIIIGEISFLTSSVATVMQLAISMDYAIMVIHRLEEERNKEEDIKSAIAKTLKYTVSSVSSSALTTIVGFSVLMFMTNKIGFDLGFVLAKGIVISLAATMILLPCLILSFNKIINKTTHKSYLPKFDKISNPIIKFRYLALVILIPLGMVAFKGQSNLEYYYSFENFLYKDSLPIVDTNKIIDTMGQVQGIDVVIPNKGEAFEKDLSKELKRIENVEAVVTMIDLIGEGLPEIALPTNIKDMYISGEYRKLTVQLDVNQDSVESFKAVNEIEKLIDEKIEEEFYLSGSAVTSRDTAEIAKKDNLVVTVLSIAAIGLILFITFKSLTLPIMLILTIQFSIWINLYIAYLSGDSIANITTIFLSAIQLGATVDYAIMFTSRYLENRKNIKLKLETARKTIKDTAISVFTSAIILSTATLGISLVTEIKTTAELTGLISRGTIISTIMVYTLLPALFIVFDKLIIKTTKGLRDLREVQNSKNKDELIVD